MKFTTFLKFAKEHKINIHPSKRYVGIIFTLSAWFLLAFSTVLFEESSQRNPVFVNFFFQFLAAFFAFSICMLFQGKKFFIGKETKLIWTRALLAILTYYAYFSARIWTNIIDNSLLFSTDALFVPIIMLIILQEKIASIAWGGLILGFLGAGFVYSFDIQLHSTGGIIGGVIGFSSGIGLAAIVLLTSYMVKKDPPLRIAFYQSLLGVISSGILAVAFGWQNPAWQDLLFMLFAGLFFAVALFLFLDSFYYTEAYILGTLSYALTLFVVIIDWIVNQQLISFKTILGSVLIVSGGIIVIISSYHHNKKKKSLKKLSDKKLTTSTQK